MRRLVAVARWQKLVVGLIALHVVLLASWFVFPPHAEVLGLVACTLALLMLPIEGKACAAMGKEWLIVAILAALIGLALAFGSLAIIVVNLTGLVAIHYCGTVALKRAGIAVGIFGVKRGDLDRHVSQALDDRRGVLEDVHVATPETILEHLRQLPTPRAMPPWGQPSRQRGIWLVLNWVFWGSVLSLPALIWVVICLAGLEEYATWKEVATWKQAIAIALALSALVATYLVMRWLLRVGWAYRFGKVAVAELFSCEYSYVSDEATTMAAPERANTLVLSARFRANDDVSRLVPMTPLALNPADVFDACGFYPSVGDMVYLAYNPARPESTRFCILGFSPTKPQVSVVVHRRA